MPFTGKPEYVHPKKEKLLFMAFYFYGKKNFYFMERKTS